MASNIAGLAKNLEESIASIGGIFQKSTSKGDGTYPGDEGSLAGAGGAIKKVLSNIEPENWTKSFPYTFSVLDSPQTLDKAGDSRLGFTDFPLPLNPSDLSQDETFSVKLTATQGGTVIQQGGVRYGDLIIAGTTGVHPFRGAGGASKITGKAILQPDDLKHKSGYEVFQRLRNWFRAYYQMKHVGAGDPAVQKARLCFKNFKDGEFLIVELTKFSLRRSASRKTLYDYTLQFRILGHVAFAAQAGAGGFFADLDNVVNQAHNAIDTARGSFLRAQDILRQIESTYENTVLEPLRKAALALKAFAGIGTTAADMRKQAISETMSTLATLNLALGLQNLQAQAKTSSTVDSRIANAKLPGNVEKAVEAQGSDLILNLGRQSDVLMAIDSSLFPEETLLALSEDQEAALQLPRSYFEDAIAEITRVRDNAADKFNLGDPIYDEAFDRVVSTPGEVTKTATDREFELLAAFETALQGLNYLLSTNALFKSPYSERIETVQTAFEGQLTALQAQPAVKEIVMPQNVDLERLALQQLGDVTRWVEIAEVNDLKAPYVVQDLTDLTPNTVRPGEKILIPQPIVEGFGSTPTVKERFINEDLNAVERNLGIDLRLTEDFDLALGNRGDLEVIRGAENAAQAVVLKLMYDKGDLLEHPELGVGLQVGSKVPTVSEIKTNLIQTLSMDPRFKSVENLEIVRSGPEIRLNFLLRVKNVDTPVPVSLKL